jgi:DNA-binding FadR family transcriptional regulator
MQESNDVRLIEFIRGSIPSVWALDLLMVMRRSPARLWSEAELVGELRASEAVVRGVLGRFEADRLVARSARGRYRFEPKSSCLDQLCEALAEAYRDRPHAVMQAITRA